MRPALTLILALCALSLAGCGHNPAPRHEIADTPIEQPATGLLKWVLPDRGDSSLVAPQFRWLSAACFVAGIGLLLMNFRKEAAYAIAGAVLAPAVGMAADIIAGLVVYAIVLGMILSGIAAWYFVRARYAVPDDGTLFKKRKPGIPIE
jgi:hypothetical protein